MSGKTANIYENNFFLDVWINQIMYDKYNNDKASFDI